MANSRSDRPAIPRFGLIGCGRIGSLYDEGAPDGPALSVAGALTRSPWAELAAVCDADPARARTCAEIRGVAACFSNYREMLATENLDAIAICTPPSHRPDIVEAALENGVRLIWCEKPVAASLDEARAIERLIADRNIVFAVNYLRRWAPVTARLASLIQTGELGPAQSATLTYCKGIANNGSHFIDLMTHFFGVPRTATALRQLNDGREASDPTLDAVITFQGSAGAFPFRLIALDHRNFTVCELDIVLAKGRIKLLDGGDVVEIFRTAPDPVVPGYTTLSLAERHAHALDDTLERTVEQVVRVYHGEENAPLCGITDGISALHAVDCLLRSWDLHGAPVSTSPISG
ncbi:MAG: Gfo/Idh/MocA family protein [Sphingomonadales bacterium]